jgi:hypothetical protein
MRIVPIWGKVACVRVPNASGHDSPRSTHFVIDVGDGPLRKRNATTGEQ